MSLEFKAILTPLPPARELDQFFTKPVVECVNAERIFTTNPQHSKPFIPQKYRRNYTGDCFSTLWRVD